MIDRTPYVPIAAKVATIAGNAARSDGGADWLGVVEEMTARCSSAVVVIRLTLATARPHSTIRHRLVMRSRSTMCLTR